MNLTAVHGVEERNFTISIGMIVWCIKVLHIWCLAELLVP